MAVELERDLAVAIAGAAPTPTAKPGVVAALRARLTRRRVDGIDPKRQEWLLPGLVLIGAETLLAGVGGLGKSTLACQWIADLTTGNLGQVGNAMIVSFEDAAEEVIRPRLQAAGADLSRVFVVQKEGGVIVLPDDLQELTREAHETEARLIVIDPVSASLSLKLDSHRDQDVHLRRVLDEAKIEAGMTGTDQRLSWHSLRHSFASMLATDLELPATTLARLTGHKDAGFTLKVYARDGRDEATVVADVLARAAGQGVGR